MKIITPILPKIGCHGNVPWGIKNWPELITLMQIPSIWWKNRENRPVDPEIALLNLKKTEGKSYTWSAGLPSGLNNC